MFIYTLEYIILITLFLVNSYNQKCALTQDKSKEKPYKYKEPKDPELLNLPIEELACPNYYNQKVCCNAVQNQDLVASFKTLDASFSTKYSGCDYCSINLKKLWCAFTCSPNQADFVSNIHDIKKFDKDLAYIEIDISEDSNCELFKSCKKTNFASMVPAMGNAIGFTTFQGDQAHNQALVYIKFNYKKNDSLAMNEKYYPCNSEYKEGKLPDNFVLEQKCSCNSCESLCVYEGASKYINPLNGLNYIHILIVYSIIIILTIIFIFFKKFIKNTNTEPHIIGRDSDLLSIDTVISEDDILHENYRKKSVN